MNENLIIETLKKSIWIPHDFIELFEKFNSKENKLLTFDELKELNETYQILETYLDNLSVRFKDDNDELLDPINLNKNDFIELIQTLIDKQLIERKNEFINLVNESSNAKEILYSSYTTLTKSTINKRYYELAKYFHPDKNSSNNSSNEIFNKIKEYRDELLLLNQSDERPSKVNELIYYEIEGNYYLKLAIDFLHASNEDWTKLELHVKESFINLNKNHMLYYMKQYLELAYDNFKQACKYADEERNYEKMFILREYLFKCKSLLNNNSNESKLIAYSMLINYYLFNKNYSIEQKNKILDMLGINDESSIDLIISQLLLKSDRNEFIMLNKREWIEQKRRIKDLESKTRLFFSSLGLRSLNERKQMSNEYEIHGKINSSLLLCLNEDNYYLDYLKEISNEKINLIKLPSSNFRKLYINTSEIVDTLISFNFTPDNIAYILITISISLLNSNVIKYIQHYLPKITYDDLLYKSLEILKSLEHDDRLMDKANELDGIVRKRKLRAKQLPTLIKSLKHIEKEFKTIIHGARLQAIQDKSNSPLSLTFKEKLNEAKLLSLFNIFLIKLIKQKKYLNSSSDNDDNIQSIKFKFDIILNKLSSLSSSTTVTTSDSSNSLSLINDIYWIIFGNNKKVRLRFMSINVSFFMSIQTRVTIQVFLTELQS